MTASVFDSPLLARLFPTSETGRLFSDTAAIRAMLLVEGAIAKIQGEMGIIPSESAAAIHRASLEVQIDPGALAESTGTNGVCIPGLVAAFRTEMKAPEHAQYVHWGATSQDIMDTALMLRLRQAFKLAEKDLTKLVKQLGDTAQKHAYTPMPARTYGQHATPTSWGAVVAEWGNPLLAALSELEDLRTKTLFVSLSGAAGTSAALGENASELRTRLAATLGLNDPGRTWHVDRSPLLHIAGWQSRVMAALAHLASSVIALTATDCGEIILDAAGRSSTMPQKQNPVAPSALVAIQNQFAGLYGALQSAAAHQHQRDGASWFTEWMIVPQMSLSIASALKQANDIAETATPNVERMQMNLRADLGLIHAEALSFALASQMPRTEAQAQTKQLCTQAQQTKIPLSQIAQEAFPDLPTDLFEADQQMGQAPANALDFAQRAAVV